MQANFNLIAGLPKSVKHEKAVPLFVFYISVKLNFSCSRLCFLMMFFFSLFFCIAFWVLHFAY